MPRTTDIDLSNKTKKMKVSKNFDKITPTEFAKARDSVKVDIKKRIYPINQK